LVWVTVVALQILLTLLYMTLVLNFKLCQAASVFLLYFVDPFDGLSSYQQCLVVLFFSFKFSQTLQLGRYL